MCTSTYIFRQCMVQSHYNPRWDRLHGQDNLKVSSVSMSCMCQASFDLMHIKSSSPMGSIKTALGTQNQCVFLLRKSLSEVGRS